MCRAFSGPPELFSFGCSTPWRPSISSERVRLKAGILAGTGGRKANEASSHGPHCRPFRDADVDGRSRPLASSAEEARRAFRSSARTRSLPGCARALTRASMPPHGGLSVSCSDRHDQVDRSKRHRARCRAQGEGLGEGGATHEAGRVGLGCLRANDLTHHRPERVDRPLQLFLGPS